QPGRAPRTCRGGNEKDAARQPQRLRPPSPPPRRPGPGRVPPPSPLPAPRARSRRGSGQHRGCRGDEGGEGGRARAPRRGRGLAAAVNGRRREWRRRRLPTEFSRTVLYPYCAPYALELDYRQNLLKKELAGYSADLVCLQEVDRSAFAESLAPALDAFGLEGLFRMKEKQHEGLATFYRRDKLGAGSAPVLKIPPVLLQSVLSNMFLCFLGGNIRLIQIAIALSHIKHIACDLYPSIPIIFCGDFNSTPSSGAYSFINSERCNMTLSHPFKLQSACGEPAYTNYVGGFHGCLDYIFIDKNALEVEQVIPLPSHEEVTTHQALPSVSHPSDHIGITESQNG
uniref:Phosphodiesterase 12 n=1 Tax=Apteryx owenii TaxID=8824 RepID=A0A8B9SCC2_APTOW